MQSYVLDLRVQPEEQRLSGEVTVEAVVVADLLNVFELDLASSLEVDGVHVGLEG